MPVDPREDIPDTDKLVWFSQTRKPIPNNVPTALRGNCLLGATAALAFCSTYGSGPGALTSGFRTPAVNAADGGASHSDHLEGLAFDAVLSPAGMLAALVDARKGTLATAGNGFDQIAFYNDHVHVSLARPGEKPRFLIYSARAADEKWVRVESELARDALALDLGSTRGARGQIVQGTPPSEGSFAQRPLRAFVTSKPSRIPKMPADCDVSLCTSSLAIVRDFVTRNASLGPIEVLVPEDEVAGLVTAPIPGAIITSVRVQE